MIVQPTAGHFTDPSYSGPWKIKSIVLIPFPAPLNYFGFLSCWSRGIPSKTLSSKFNGLCFSIQFSWQFRSTPEVRTATTLVFLLTDTDMVYNGMLFMHSYCHLKSISWRHWLSRDAYSTYKCSRTYLQRNAKEPEHVSSLDGFPFNEGFHYRKRENIGQYTYITCIYVHTFSLVEENNIGQFMPFVFMIHMTSQKFMITNVHCFWVTHCQLTFPSFLFSYSIFFFFFFFFFFFLNGSTVQCGPSPP
jgi:hypothetical protein